MTAKLAVKKNLEYELKNLKKEEERVVKKWEDEVEKFYSKHEKDIKKYENFDRTSKILESIDTEKVREYEEMLNKLYSQTNLENIDSLVNYFANCLKEYKNFEEFIETLSKKIEGLEVDVRELEVNS